MPAMLRPSRIALYRDELYQRAVAVLFARLCARRRDQRESLAMSASSMIETDACRRGEPNLALRIGPAP